MKNNFTIAGLLLMSAIIWSSCKKKNYSNDPIASQWLLPLLKGDFEPLNITTLNNKTFEFTVTAEDIGFVSGVPASSPVDFTAYAIGPYEIQTNDLVYGVDLEICDIDLTITNHFPTTLKSGTTISIKNTGTVAAPAITSFTLTSDLAQGDAAIFPIDLDNQRINNKLYVFIDTLRLEAFDNETIDDIVTCKFHFKEVSISNVDINTNRSYIVSDTADFDGSSIAFDENNANITDSTVHATITFKATNELPLNMALQAYFLDASNNVIDSIFSGGASITGAEYNGNMYVGNSASRTETYISKSRLEQLKEASKTVYYLELNSNGYTTPFISVSKDKLLSLRVTGDIKIILSPLLLD